ncbi:merozoite surface protein 1 [Tupanvirus soda lake]|uniref:Merozoite surface protein 1 n=2 Tax=Tupanvirus TaxID=2094720 RepID=A0A6N1NJ88_9VIRU|nr:merozoite surface protein 1 [Tupanvirus soda lake]QKU34974.1 merozoite surface protein 1 [Tupanvirus soda lake]
MTKTTIIIIAVVIIIIIVLMFNDNNNNNSHNDLVYNQVPIDTFRPMSTYPYVSSTYNDYYNRVYANDPTYAKYLSNVYGAYDVNFNNGNDPVAQQYSHSIIGRDPAVVNASNDPAVVGGGKPTNRGAGTVYGSLSNVPTGGIKLYNRFPSVMRRREFFNGTTTNVPNESNMPIMSPGVPSAPTITPSAPTITPSAPTITPSAPTITPSAPSVPITSQLDGVFIPSGTNCLTVLPGKLVISATSGGLVINQGSNGVPTPYVPEINEAIAAEHFCNIGVNEPDNIFGDVKPYDQDMHVFGKSKDYDSFQAQDHFELLNN